MEELKKRWSKGEKKRVARATTKMTIGPGAPMRCSSHGLSQATTVAVGGSNLDNGTARVSKQIGVVVVEVELSDEDFVDYRKKSRFQIQLEQATPYYKLWLNTKNTQMF